jgi:hypothetical protein
MVQKEKIERKKGGIVNEDLLKIQINRSEFLEKMACERVSEVFRKNKKGGCYHPR